MEQDHPWTLIIKQHTAPILENQTLTVMMRNTILLHLKINTVQIITKQIQ